MQMSLLLIAGVAAVVVAGIVVGIVFLVKSGDAPGR
jgi:hypothetical protein